MRTAAGRGRVNTSPKGARVMSMAKMRARSFAHAMRRGRGEELGEEAGESSGRAKSSANYGGGGGAGGLGMTCSRRRRWWLASTP